MPDRPSVPASAVSEAREKAREWSAQHPVGTWVVVWRDDGTATLTQVRRPAEAFGRDVVVWLVGIAGCYHVSRVRPIDLAAVRAEAFTEARRVVERLRGSERVEHTRHDGDFRVWEPSPNGEMVRANELLTALAGLTTPETSDG